jgi:hypothetical protein
MKSFYAKVGKRNVGEIICYVAHEKASSKTDYEHSHVFVDFGKTFSSRSSRVFDYNGIHPNIAPIVTKKFDAVFRYISKEDPDLVDLKVKYAKTTGSLAERVWSYKTVQDALAANVSEYADAAGVMTLFNNKMVEDKKPAMPPEAHLHYEWQRQLWVSLLRKDEWDYRSLIWIYDEMGSMGKSRFAECWKSNYDACVLTAASGQRDTATIVLNDVMRGWNKQVIFLDFPRGEATHKVYTAIETFLNGQLTVAKFNGKSLQLTPEDGSLKPKVVVFANWMPNYSGVNTLSTDRFLVWHIYPDGRFAVLPNPVRDERIKRSKSEKVTPWTLEMLESAAKTCESPEQLRFKHYCLETDEEREYVYKDEENMSLENSDSELENVFLTLKETQKSISVSVPQQQFVPQQQSIPQQQQTVFVPQQPQQSVFVPQQQFMPQQQRSVFVPQQPQQQFMPQQQRSVFVPQQPQQQFMTFNPQKF